MAFTWSSIAVGDKVLADHANTLRTNANTLITLMTANTGKCSNYSCSSLGTIPDAVSSGTTIVYGSWLDGMKASIDRIDTNKYCAAQLIAQNYPHNGAHVSGHYQSQHGPRNVAKLTTNHDTNCGSVKATNHRTDYTNYTDDGSN